MLPTPEERKRELEAAHIRAARDAEVLGLADSVISDSRSERTQNGWADMVGALFRGK